MYILCFVLTLVFLLKQCQLSSAKHLISHLAVEAPMWLTVVLIQVYQRLRVGCGMYLLSQRGPLSYDSVVFFFDILQPFDGIFYAFALRVRVFIGNHRVD